MSDLPQNSPRVSTSYGVVVGRQTDAGLSWKGVPYAAPPVGKLRFKRPVRADRWEGELDCGTYRSASLQYPKCTPLPQTEEGMPGGTAESCLFLNIWAPSGAKDLPVFVWVHGGGFLLGSANEGTYDMTRLAREGLVCVSMNYRLGLLGFMRVQGGDGNCGLWDQAFALQWVREEIAAFGGDPANVTLAGESAGGFSALCLCASRQTNRLFHKAWIMSSYTQASPLAAGERFASRFAGACGAAPTAAALQALSAEELQNLAQSERPSDGPTHFPIFGWVARSIRQPEALLTTRSAEVEGLDDGSVNLSGTAPENITANLKTFGVDFSFPIIDGDLLDGHPLDLLRRGTAAHLPIVIGSNALEMGYRPVDKKGSEMTFGSMATRWHQVLSRFSYDLSVVPRLGTRGAHWASLRIARQYALQFGAGPGAAPEACQRCWDALVSDLAYNATVLAVGDRQSAHGRTYVYRFDGYNAPAAAATAFHAWDLAGWFGAGLPVPPPGGEPPPLPPRLASYMRCVSLMMSSLVGFAKRWDPNTPGLPRWEPYTAASPKAMVFHSPCRAVEYARDLRPGIIAMKEGLEEWLGLEVPRSRL